MSNNILDMTKEENRMLIASVLCVLCENHPITVDLRDLARYWGTPELARLQYDMASDSQGKSGAITFSLKGKAVGAIIPDPNPNRSVWQAHIEQAASDAEVGDFTKMETLLDEIMTLINYVHLLEISTTPLNRD